MPGRAMNYSDLTLLFSPLFSSISLGRCLSDPLSQLERRAIVEVSCGLNLTSRTRRSKPRSTDLPSFNLPYSVTYKYHSLCPKQLSVFPPLPSWISRAFATRRRTGRRRPRVPLARTHSSQRRRLQARLCLSVSDYFLFVGPDLKRAAEPTVCIVRNTVDSEFIYCSGSAVDVIGR